MRMHIKSNIGIFIFGLAAIFSISQNYAQKNNNLGDANPGTYEPTQLIEDFNYLFSTLENIHPDLYFYTPKDTINTYRQIAIGQLDHPMTALDFWKIITPVVVKIKDGHTGLYFPYETWKRNLNNNGTIFPCKVKADSNLLYVSKNYTDDSLIGINSRILSINKIPVESILQTMRSYHNGERQSFIDLKVSGYFKLYLWALFNFEGSYQIEFISSVDGKQHNKTFRGITQETFKSFSQSAESNSRSYLGKKER